MNNNKTGYGRRAIIPPWADTLIPCSSRWSTEENWKVLFGKKVRKVQASVETISRNSACVIDGMALVQRLDGSNMSFMDVSDSIPKKAEILGSTSHRIDVVFDVYINAQLKMLKEQSEGQTQGLPLCR